MEQKFEDLPKAYNELMQLWQSRRRLLADQFNVLMKHLNHDEEGIVNEGPIGKRFHF